MKKKRGVQSKVMDQRFIITFKPSPNKARPKQANPKPRRRVRRTSQLPPTNEAAASDPSLSGRRPSPAPRGPRRCVRRPSQRGGIRGGIFGTTISSKGSWNEIFQEKVVRKYREKWLHPTTIKGHLGIIFWQTGFEHSFPSFRFLLSRIIFHCNSDTAVIFQHCSQSQFLFKHCGLNSC